MVYFSTKNDRICTKTSDCGADRRRRRKKEGIIVCLRQSFKVENFIFSSDEGGPKEAPKDSPLAPWLCHSQMLCQKFFDAFTSPPKSITLNLNWIILNLKTDSPYSISVIWKIGRYFIQHLNIWIWIRNLRSRVIKWRCIHRIIV